MVWTGREVPPDTITLKARISTDAFGGDANFQHIADELDGNLIVGSPLKVPFPLIDVREFCLHQSIVNSTSVPGLEFAGFPPGTSFHFPANSCMSVSWGQLCVTRLSQHRGR